MTTKTNKNLKKVVALGLCGVLLASIGIGAYLTDTDVKKDVYTVGNVQAEIVSVGDMELDNVGALLPGTVHRYERAASNTGINDAYVFMSLTIPYEMVGVSDEDGSQIGERTRQLFIPGVDGGYIGSEWKLVDVGYIGQYEIEDNGQHCGEHDKYSAVVGDTITYVYGYIGDNADSSLKALASGETTSNLVETMELTNLYHADKIDGEVSTKLYAIQSANVNGGLTDVNGVWAVINKALVGEANNEQVTTYHEMISGSEFKALLPSEATAVEFIAMPRTYSLADRTVPADAIDVSKAQDGSIMAWLEDTTFYVVAMDGGKIVATDTNEMFQMKSNLQTVNFENLEITSFGKQMFILCQNLTSIIIPASVESIDYNAIAVCNKLQSVTFERNSKLKTIGNQAFAGCSLLTEITIPASVETIDAFAFTNCTNLASITFEKNSNLKKVADGVFIRCNLTEINLPTSVETIYPSAFAECANLANINVDPANENYISVDGVLFTKDMGTLVEYPAGKTNTNYIIPNTVKEISNYAFFECTSLTEINLSNNITTIGEYAFNKCTGLKTINFAGTQEQWNAITFGDMWNVGLPADYAINFLGE